MTAAGLIFVLLGFGLSIWLTVKRMSVVRPAPVLLYVWHTGFCIFYWWSSKGSPDPDAMKYFALADSYMPFGIATPFMFWLVQHVFQSVQLVGIDMTYLDFFLLFNVFGFGGLMYLLRALEETLGSALKEYRVWPFLVMMLPGLSFWTSALGKDSLIFLGICMIVYAGVDIRRRWWLAGAGIVLTFLVRPHIGLLPLGAMGVHFLTSRKTPLILRIAGALAAVVGVVTLLPMVLEIAQLTSVDRATISEYVSTRQGYNMEGGGGVDMSRYNILMRMFAYMYRPLYIDAPNFMGIAASLENTVLLGFSVYIVVNTWRLFPRILKNPIMFVNFLYFGVCLVMLASMTSNLGIAVRQKTMFLPSLFLLSFFLVRERAAEKNGFGATITGTLYRVVRTPPAAQDHSIAR